MVSLLKILGLLTLNVKSIENERNQYCSVVFIFQSFVVTIYDRLVQSVDYSHSFPYFGTVDMTWLFFIPNCKFNQSVKHSQPEFFHKGYLLTELCNIGKIFHRNSHESKTVKILISHEIDTHCFEIIWNTFPIGTHHFHLKEKWTQITDVERDWTDNWCGWSMNHKNSMPFMLDWRVDWSWK